MAAERSDKSPYRSRFGGGWISPAQYLAENMCDRLARRDKQELPARFWAVERWKRPYLVQLRHANSLLKLYSAPAVIRALRTDDGKKIFSLSAPWLDQLVKVEQERIDRQAAKEAERPAQEPQPAPSVAEQPRQGYRHRPGLLDKLRALDGEEERDGGPGGDAEPGRTA